MKVMERMAVGRTRMNSMMLGQDGKQEKRKKEKTEKKERTQKQKQR